MNNSFLVLQGLLEQETPDTKPYLKKRLTEVTEIYEALRAIRNSKHWKLLEERVWDEVKETIQRQLDEEENPVKINKLQGKKQLANKYFNLQELERSFINEAEIIKSQINANSEINEN